MFCGASSRSGGWADERGEEKRQKMDEAVHEG
jgi:hypothetical protein